MAFILIIIIMHKSVTILVFEPRPIRSRRRLSTKRATSIQEWLSPDLIGNGSNPRTVKFVYEIIQWQLSSLYNNYTLWFSYIIKYFSKSMLTHYQRQDHSFKWLIILKFQLPHSKTSFHKLERHSWPKRATYRLTYKLTDLRTYLLS